MSKIDYIEARARILRKRWGRKMDSYQNNQHKRRVRAATQWHMADQLVLRRQLPEHVKFPERLSNANEPIQNPLMPAVPY
ncbi:MAG: hypothetical protein RLZZ283_353 [Candidatus Parcubacteria bacterium]|jgi:hypothetical protein